VLAAALSVLAPAACAASFDCGKASAADEHAVCDARALNDQDVRMALLFDLTQRLVPMGTRDDQKDAQVAFLAARRACGGERPCIAALYQRRIAELMAIMARVESNGPF